jgi:hypothetical protein
MIWKMSWVKELLKNFQSELAGATWKLMIWWFDFCYCLKNLTHGIKKSKIESKLIISLYSRSVKQTFPVLKSVIVYNEWDVLNPFKWIQSLVLCVDFYNEIAKLKFGFIVTENLSLQKVKLKIDLLSSQENFSMLFFMV